ncbi:tyrosine-type recombinase/integrase [Arthrobacter sp. NPDC057013]|uniref:tyrosine-type recombinase/integrase n=1 Tax=Arthrobacter sp. NPDC057013 TaxID=3345999 RepID=UPI003635ECC9
MARAKMPAWQLFQYTPTKDESGRWTARGRYNDDAGVRHDIKRSGRTKGAADLALRRAVEEAQKRAEQRMKEAEAAKAEASIVTLEELSERWLAVRKPSPVEIDETTQTGASPTNGLRMQSWTSYAGNLRRHLLPVLGGFPVGELKTPDCEKAIHSLYDKEDGTGYRTADLAKQVLSQIMDYAVRQGHRADNPVRFVSNVPSPKKRPTRLKPSTVAAVHEAVRARQPEKGVGGPKPTGRLSDVVKFLFATGMRIGEALAVRWDDIQFDGDRILITVSGTLIEKDGLFYRQDYPKSDSQRILQLTQDWIQDMIRLRHMNKRNTRTNAVFATRNGTFVRPSNFRSDLRKANKAAGIHEKISPHRFRSTVSSEIAEYYRDEAAQQQLGHSSPETTRRHYIHRPEIVPDYSDGLKNVAPPKKGKSESD